MADFEIKGSVVVSDRGEYLNAVSRLGRKGVELMAQGNEELAEQIEKTLSKKLGKTYKAKTETKLIYDSNAGEVVQQTKKVLPILDEMNKLIKKNEKAQEGSVTSLKGQLRYYAQMRDSIAKIDPATGKISQAWAAANQQVQATNVSLAKAGGNIFEVAQAKFPVIGQVMKLGAQFNQVVMIATSVVQVLQLIDGALKPLIARAKQIESLKLAMEGFGASASESAEVVDAAKRVALTYGASLTQVEKGFKRLTPAIVQSGGSFSDSEKVMAALSARTTTLGLNTEQTGRYIEAFAQVMGKGKLQSEELTQQFSELDGALRGQLQSYFASEHGIMDLNEAMKNGEITAEMFREGFLAVSQTMQDNMAGSITDIQQRLSLLGNDTQITIQQMENLEQTLNTMAFESLAETTNNLGRSFAKMGVTTAQFFASITNDLPFIKQLFEALFSLVGWAVEAVWGVLLVTLKAVLYAADRIVGVFIKIGEAIGWVADKLGIVQPLKEIWVGFEGVLRGFGNRLLSLGDAAVDANSKFAEYQSRARELAIQFMEGSISAEEYAQGIKDLKDEAEQAGDAKAIKVIDTAVEKAKQTLEEYRVKLDEEMEKLTEVKEKLIERYEEENEQIEGTIQKLKDKLQDEKDAYQEAKEAIKDRYDQEKSQIEEIRDAVMERYQLELDKLNEISPTQQRLNDIRREELTQKLQSADLTEKERLELLLQLENMDKRQKRQEIMNKKKADSKKFSEELKQIDGERLDQLDAAKKLYEENAEGIQGEIDTAEKGIEANQERIKVIQQEADALKAKYGQAKQSTEELTTAFNDQVGATDAAGQALDKASQSAREITSQFDTAQQAAKELAEQMAAVEGIASGRTPNVPNLRFAGGSVTGGQKYTVNELGQESFLSSSGMLKKINAKSWGEWRAPSSGTVIPAHITKNLDIPATGVNLNTSPNVARNPLSAGRSSRSNATSMDRITNNITINAVNPTQEASHLMVNVMKQRNRRRF